MYYKICFFNIILFKQSNFNLITLHILLSLHRYIDTQYTISSYHLHTQITFFFFTTNLSQVTYIINLTIFSLNLHHIITHIFIFVEFTFFLCGCILVLLVFRYQIIHVGFSFSEFHLVHTFTSVPM